MRRVVSMTCYHTTTLGRVSFGPLDSRPSVIGKTNPLLGDLETPDSKTGLSRHLRSGVSLVGVSCTSHYQVTVLLPSGGTGKIPKSPSPIRSSRGGGGVGLCREPCVTHKTISSPPIPEFHLSTESSLDPEASRPYPARLSRE